MQTLPGEVAQIPFGDTLVGPADPSTTLSLDVTLQPRDPAALAAAVQAVSTKGSAQYHQFINPTEFAQLYGPTSATIAQVTSALEAEGLTVGAVSSTDLSLPVTATVAQAESAFATPIDAYKLPSGGTGYYNTAAPSVPTSVAPQIEGVVGLDTLNQPHPTYTVPPAKPTSFPRSTGGLTPPVKPTSTSPLAPAPQLAPGQPTPTGATCQSDISTVETDYGALDADDLAQAYSFGSLYTNDHYGAGTTVALVELDDAGFSMSDITTFADCYGITLGGSQVTQTLVNGTGATGGNTVEAELDIDTVLSLAPQANIDVYEDQDGDIYDDFSAIIGADTAKIVSASWAACEADDGSAYQNEENTLLEEAAMNGQTIFSSSGDDGSEGCNANDEGGTATGDGPVAQAVVPSTGTLYVANLSDDTVSVISEASGDTVDTVSTGSEPDAVLYDAADSDVYVANYADNTLTEFSTTDCSASVTSGCGTTNTYPSGNLDGPTWLALDGTSLYVANSTNSVEVFDTASTDFYGPKTLPSGATPTSVVADLTNGDIYVADSTNNAVDYFSAATCNDTSQTGCSTTGSAITGMSDPLSMTLDPVNGDIYVANDGGGIPVISPSSNTLLETISTSASPTFYSEGDVESIGMSPDNDQVLAAAFTTIGDVMITVNPSTQAVLGTVSMNNGGDYMGQMVSDPDSDLVWTTDENADWDALQNLNLSVNDPASQPLVTGVGGTRISALGPAPTESVWNDSNEYAAGAGGGGISKNFDMPSYQTALGEVTGSSGTPCGNGSGDCREVPDVSADADPYSGYVIYDSVNSYDWTDVGGTSGASPLWAAVLADISSADGTASTGYGSLNPDLYSLAAASPGTYFNDVTSGNNDYNNTDGGQFPAMTHYDMATGLGTPIVSGLATGLAPASSYTVTFNANGGSGTMASETEDTATDLTTNAFTYTGHTFSGWNTAANGTGTAYANDASYPFTASVTLYAQWTAIDYTVTFNANGGTGTMANETEPYNTPTDLTANAYTYTGHTFTGWNTAANGSGTAYSNDASYPFTASVTLYAQWSTTDYTVTFNANGGTGTMANETEPYNTATDLTANAYTYTGHTFTGWNTAANGSGTAYANDASYPFTASATLYAQWSVNSYTVTFNANGGTGTMANETEPYNTATDLTANAYTYTGHTFTGWNTAANGSGTAYANDASYPFTASATLYAQWSVNNYTVTFNANGGTGTMANETEAYNTPTDLTANAYTYTGNTFTGWNTAANGSGTAYANDASYPFTASATLYAQWTANTNYTVTFNANGGSGSMAPQSDNVPTDLTANAYTYTGHTFSGWNTAANGTGTAYANDASYPFTASVTLYAQWTVIDYTVTFNANGGTGTMANETEPYGTATDLTANAFTYTGYTFTGWNTAANGSGTAYANDASYPFTASATLYAQWTVTEYTVTFNANGGTGTMAPEVDNTATDLTANAFTYAGNTFTGWNTAMNGSGTAYANDASYPFTASVTLYAQWTANPSYTVTFNANGGTGTMANETENVPTDLTANAFTYAGNTFTGWNTAMNGSGTAYANDASYPFTASVTLYAQWTANSNFTVTFDANGGTGSMSPESENTPTDLTANAYTYTGHTFAGWNTAMNGSGTAYANDASYPFTASVTLYAQWTAIDYTVTFNANGGTGTMANETEPYNTATDLTANAFTYAGNTFTGWNTAMNGSGTAYANDASYPFTASVTLYAQWTVSIDYTVTFNANGGTGTMAVETENTPTNLTANAFTYAGYTFTGWNTAMNGSGTAYANEASYPFTSSVTLYAQWQQQMGPPPPPPAGYTVTFDANGGTGSMAPETASAATDLTANAFTYTGHTFTGWNTVPDGSGTAYANDASYPFTSSVTLYAQWSAATSFTVTFNANGGTGSMAPEMASAPTTLTANAFTYAGHTFKGWNTAPNGSGTAYANDASYPFTASVTLYAQWTAKAKFTVTFRANGGRGSMAPERNNVPAALTPNAFSYAGHVFIGWNTRPNGSGKAYANRATYSFRASVTLYAQWAVRRPIRHHG
jgi:YVTN family beta-propeller protein